MFSKSIKTCIKKYFKISGRASKSEFWYFAFLVFVINFSEVIFYFDYVAFSSSMSLILLWLLLFANLFLLIPFLTVICRRLHDTGRSSAGILLLFLPVIGFVILMVMLSKNSDGDNIYGSHIK